MEILNDIGVLCEGQSVDDDAQAAMDAVGRAALASAGARVVTIDGGVLLGADGALDRDAAEIAWVRTHQAAIA